MALAADADATAPAVTDGAGPHPLETVLSAEGPIVADDPSFFDGISVDLSFTVLSKYVGSSGGIVFSDDPVVQSELVVSFESGLYFAFWNSTGLNGGGFSSDFGDEFDITIGWEWEIESLFNIDAGVSYFDLFPVGKFSTNDTEDGGDVIQPFVKLFRDFKIDERHTITPHFRVESMFGALNNNQGETYIHGGVTHLIELSESWSVSHRFDLCYDPGAFGFDNGFIADYSVGLTWRPGSRIEVNMTPFRLVVPLGSIDDERDPEVVFSLGVTFHF